VFVHPSVAATTMSELVAFARANPGKLNYASFGLGSQPHLAVEWLKSRVGIDLVHVPYNGTAPAMTAFLAGQVQVYYGTIGPAVPHVRAGKIRPLAVVGTERTPQLPDVPSFKEAGYTDIDMRVWFGIVAPASTPRDIVARLGDFIATTVRSPAFLNTGTVAGALFSSAT
jgi:tripartite-type tricarboxylate transporter receptor subunit TctC